jgi:endo-1,4-beta-D-glucanase Y
MARLRALALAGLTLLMTTYGAAAGSVTAEEWKSYKDKFLEPSGRIVDTANNNISHSEGQGYGLLLAYLAQNRGDFDTIWAFTRTEMLLRDDGLAVWRWDPAATPHVSDSNNATDGDLLIAYAAALAGRDWQRPDLVEVATGMAAALGESSVEEIAGSVMLKPGNVGFGPGDRPDGPVVNPSYWVFEALPVLAALAPDGPWDKLADGGKALTVASMNIGPSKLPPDWVSLKARPTPAEGFPQEFGYNAIRIPLYLMRAGMRDRPLLQAFQKNMADADGRVRLVDIKTGATRQTLDDAGYKVIPALIGCVLDNMPLPDDVKRFEPTEYYPSTLHLLALSFARRRHPECL